MDRRTAPRSELAVPEAAPAGRAPHQRSEEELYDYVRAILPPPPASFVRVAPLQLNFRSPDDASEVEEEFAVDLPVPPSSSVYNSRVATAPSEGAATGIAAVFDAAARRLERILEREGLSTKRDDKKLPRSQWLATVFKKNADVLELYSQLTAVPAWKSALARNANGDSEDQNGDAQDAQFVGGTALPRFRTGFPKQNCAATDNRHVLSEEAVLTLIMHYLDGEELEDVRRIIEQESGVRYLEPDPEHGALKALLRMGVHDAKHIFDPLPAKVLGSDAEGDVDDPDVEWTDVVCDLSLHANQESEAQEDDGWDSEDAKRIQLAEDAVTVCAGSLNALIAHMTSAQRARAGGKNEAYERFIRVFLMTYRIFTTPDRLLTKLIQRFKAPEDAELAQDNNPSRASWNDKGKSAVLRAVADLLRTWVNRQPFDFDQRMIRRVVDFIDMDLSKELDMTVAKKLKVLLRVSKGERRAPHSSESRSEALGSGRKLENAPTVRVPRNIFSSSLQLWDCDPVEIARQMTLIESELFGAIQSSELLNQNWMIPDSQYLSPNLMKLLARERDIRMWVIESILANDSVKARGKRLGQFLHLAIALRELNNMQTYMSVVEGLTDPILPSLDATRAELPKKLRQEYEEILNAHYGDGKLNLSIRPDGEHASIPYIGSILDDLKARDTQPTFLDNDIIDFSKCEHLYDILEQVLQHQTVLYQLQEVPQISAFVRNLPHVDEGDEERRKAELQERAKGLE